MTRVLKKYSRVTQPLLVLGVSILMFAILTINKPEPEAKKVGRRDSVLVYVQTVKTEQPLVEITGYGTVRPQKQAEVASQVSGKVIWLSPNMVDGGFFKAGEPMFRLDDRDYQLALEASRARVAQTTTDLEIARANSRIAVEEWAMMMKYRDEESAKKNAPGALVLRKPQLNSAEAAYGAARAELNKAELNLKRTTSVAPFNCLVREENFGLGQYVNVGQTVATVIGTDAVEVVVPVSLADKRWVHKGLNQRNRESISAEISVDLGAEKLRWSGQVIRILGDVDPKGRMHRIVVQVPKPFLLGNESNHASGAALAIGMFVHVHFRPARMHDVITIPRSALHESSRVWIADEKDQLEIRRVEVVRLTKNQAFVGRGLTEGERLVITALSGASEGMKLRVLERLEKETGYLSPEHEEATK